MKGQKVATGEPTKLQKPRKKDPLVILAELPNDTYRVKKLNETIDKNFVTTAHVSQLKIWKNSEINLDDEYDECLTKEYIDYSSNENEETVTTNSKVSDKIVDKKIKENKKSEIEKVNENAPSDNIATESKRPVRIKKKPDYLKYYKC